MFQEIGTFEFNPSQREKFKDGELLYEWANQYPQLFDEQELQIADHPVPAHFFEWLGAIHLFETTGYLSLVEKYEFKRHKRKQKILKEIVPVKVLSLISRKGVQCPDLFVYAPDKTDWYFCEIKGPGDYLRRVQREYFEKLSEVSGKQIRIIRFRAATPN
jgi:hypothetical protein